MDLTNEIESAKIIISGLPDINDYSLIGSAAYMENAVDVDIAISIDASCNVLEYGHTRLIDLGFVFCSEDYAQVSNAESWTSLRRGNLNFMITNSRKFFKDYKTATEVCIALNLTNKADRIKVCQIVRDGKKASEV